jgi:PPOX class F420-dependent enzyme/OxyR family protein
MSAFTQAEIEYMGENTMCRMATIGRNGEAHVTPVTYVYNADEDAIDIGGINFANTKKWRDVQHDQNMTVLVDDFSPEAAHALRCGAKRSCIRPAAARSTRGSTGSSRSSSGFGRTTS